MNIEEFQKLRAQYRAAIQNNGRQLFSEAFKSVFEKLPSLQRISWNQYTPYFNDGDACVFGVRDFAYCFDWNQESYEDDRWDCELWTLRRNHKERDEEMKTLEAFEKMIRENFDDSIFQEIFDDHVTVEVERDGEGGLKFAVDGYEHE